MTIFSNFKIPLQKWEKILNFWDSYDYSRFSFNLNLNDKEFYKAWELEMIYNSLDFLGAKWCERVISYNVYEYSDKYDFIFEVARKFWVKTVILKITNTVLWDEEIIDSNSKKYGEYIYGIIKKYYKEFHLAFSCGLSTKIFTQQQKDFIENTVKIPLRYGCENNGGRYDINTDGTVYRCFPLQSIYTAKDLHISHPIFQDNTLDKVKRFIDSYVPQNIGLTHDENCLGNQMNKINT